MNNVIKLQGRARPRTFTNNEQIIEQLSVLIRKSTVSVAVIAREAGVSTTTIYKLAQGQTGWPRPKTLFGVLAYFKLGIQLVEL